MLAAIFAGVFVVDTLQNRGPVIEVHFSDGASLDREKSSVRFRGVDVGRVVAIALSEDLASAVVKIELDRSATGLAREGAQFWIVRPRLSMAGVSGLEALAGGPYIAALPGSGAPATSFSGLEEGPVAQPLAAPGLALVLRTPALPSIHLGSPVTYRGVEVGSVEGWKLSTLDDRVDVHVRIQEDHRDLVKPGSRFWLVSGLEADASLGSGIHLQAASALSIFEGAIAFSSPRGDGAVADGRAFELLDRPPHSLAEGLRIVLDAREVGGLHEHAPILYRGVRAGEIEGWDLAAGAQGVEVRVRIDPHYASLVRLNSRFWNVSGVNFDAGLLRGLKLHADSVETLWAGGIEFATPNDPGPPATSGTRFSLYETPVQGWRDWRPKLPLDAHAATPTPLASPAREPPPEADPEHQELPRSHREQRQNRKTPGHHPPEDPR